MPPLTRAALQLVGTRASGVVLRSAGPTCVLPPTRRARILARHPGEDTMAGPVEGPKDATPITRAQNRALLDALPFGDTQDFEDARRGFLGSLPEVEITNDQG